MNELYLSSVASTQRLAEKIGKELKSGDCLILTGELGAGKTTFTKGIAKGLEIEEMVKSPTYTIVKEYRQGRLPLYHMDVYRVAEGATDLGLEEYFAAEGVTVVEWGNLIKAELPESYVEIELFYQPEKESRRVTFQAKGPLGEQLLERISH